MKRLKELGYKNFDDFKEKTGFSSEREMTQILGYGFKNKEDFIQQTGFKSHIVAWIRSNDKCPVCRKRINENSLQNFTIE